MTGSAHSFVLLDTQCGSACLCTVAPMGGIFAGASRGTKEAGGVLVGATQRCQGTTGPDGTLRKSVRSLGAYLRASKETLGSLSYMPLLPGCHEMIMLCQMLPLQCGKTGDGGVSLSSCLTVCARHFVMVMGR